MNRILINSAAAINIAAAALIYIACSGDDGAAGPAGSSCSAQPSTSVTGGIDITCGGVPAGTLPPGQHAPGTEGTCTLTPIGATGSFNAQCGGQSYVIGGQGSGGCTITESGADNEYLTFNCGGSPVRIAKAWCGPTPYNDSRKACTDPVNGVLSDFVCGIYPWKKDVEFCANNGTKDSTYTFCGTDVAEYDPKTHFCLDKTQIGAGSVPSISYGSANNEVKPLCGAGLTFRGGDQFCQTLLAGSSRVMDKCGGAEFDEFSLCVNGQLRGSCNQVAFDPKTQFCQGGTTVLDLCINTKATPDTLKYEANQFCALGFVISSASNDDVKQNQVYSRCTGGTDTVGVGIRKVNTILNQATPGTALDQGRGSYDPVVYFCQNGGTTKAKIFNLCGDITPTVSEAAQRLGFNGQYKETEFCGNSWETSSSPNTEPVILPRCGDGEIAFDFINGTTVAATTFDTTTSKFKQGQGSYNGLAGLSVGGDPKGYYCKGSARTELTTCGASQYNGFNQDKYFCLSNAQTYHLCGLPAPSTQPTSGALAPYNPAEKYCDDRFNKIYSYVKIGQTNGSEASGTSHDINWLTENVSYAGETNELGRCYGGVQANCDKYGRLYSKAEAGTACPVGWKLPNNYSWSTLITSPLTVDSLKATTGWTPSGGTDTKKFKALPGGKGSYTPAAGNTFDQEGFSAFWWSSNAHDGLHVTPNVPVIASLSYGKGLTFNSSNFDELKQTDAGPVSGPFFFNNTSDFLSVRCIREVAVGLNPPPASKCVIKTAGNDVSTSTLCTAVDLTVSGATTLPTPTVAFE